MRGQVTSLGYGSASVGGSSKVVLKTAALEIGFCGQNCDVVHETEMIVRVASVSQ